MEETLKQKIIQEIESSMVPVTEWFQKDFKFLYPNGFSNYRQVAVISLFYFIFQQTRQIVSVLQLDLKSGRTTPLDTAIILLGGTAFEALLNLVLILSEQETQDIKCQYFVDYSRLHDLRKIFDKQKKLYIANTYLTPFLKTNHNDLLSITSYVTKWYHAMDTRLNIKKICDKIHNILQAPSGNKLYSYYERFCAYKHSDPYIVLSQWPSIKNSRSEAQREYIFGVGLGFSAFCYALLIIPKNLVHKDFSASIDCSRRICNLLKKFSEKD